MNPFLYAIRSLRKSPGFAVSALSILALGIGANTAIFSVVNAVLLRPIPYPDSDSIVNIFHVPPQQSFPGMRIFAASLPNYLDWKKQASSFERMSAIGFGRLQITGGNRPEALTVTRVQPEFFSVLRVAPAYGRAISEEECKPGRDTVIVLNHGFAQRHFGSAQGAVGRSINLNSRSVQVVGVMPERFQVNSWFPSATDALVPMVWNEQDLAGRGNHNLLVVARLRQGLTVQRARSEMNVISDRLARAYPEENTGWGATVMTLRDRLVGDVRPALLTLLGAVGFVLLIACANTANLVLARTVGRGKELAIRKALGASPSQVLRPVLTETTLLALAGGALGLLFAHYGRSLIMGALADQLPRATEANVDTTVLLFTLLTSIATGIAAGLVGSWRSVRLDLNQSLKEGGRTDQDTGRSRTRTALLVAEVALSLMLLVGAGLMIRSFWAMRGTHPGFDSSNLITMTVPSMPGKIYSDFLPAIQRLPGAVSVAATDVLPLFGGGSQQPLTIEGRPAEVFALQPTVGVRRCTPGFMQTMRIPLLAGRDFSQHDIAANRNVVLVSQSMAAKFWPGENPLGKRLRLSFTPEVSREIVGVVGDVKDRGLNVLESVPILYAPVATGYENEVSLVVRGDSDPSTLVPAITHELRRISPDAAAADVMTMDRIVATSLTQYRFGMFLFAALAGLALLLAAVGIFSVLAYTLRSRVPEIGVRMALGASVGDVIRLMLVVGMKPTVLGIAIGIAAAYALSGLLSNLIYGVTPTDAVTFAAVTAVLTLVAMLACAVPAFRATRVQPSRALRNE